MVSSRQGTSCPPMPDCCRRKTSSSTRRRSPGESLPREKHAEPEGQGAADLGSAVNAVFRGTSVVSGLGTALVVWTGLSTEFGRVGRRPRGAPARDRVRARHPPLRLPHPPGRDVPRALRLSRQCAASARSARVLPLLGGARGGAHARAAAHDRLGDAGERRGADGAAEGHRQAARRHRELRQHGHPAERQDGHAHGRADLGGPARQPARGERRDRDPARRPQQRLPDRAPEPDGRGHPPPRASGRRPVHAVDEIPFDFQRRCLSVVVVEDGRRRLLITKGAPESVLPRCASAEARRRWRRRSTRRRGRRSTTSSTGSAPRGTARLPWRTARSRRSPATRWPTSASSSSSASRPSSIPVRGCGGDARRAAGRRDRGQDRHGRQRARHAEDLLPGRARRRRGAPGRRHRAHVRPRAGRRRRADRRLRPRLADPEESHRAGAARAGPRGRRDRGRHQRRARAPLGGRRHLGGERRGRRQGRRRHHPAREAAGGAPRRGGGRPAELRQYHEVRADGHQLEFRQYAEHGGGLAVPAIFAHAADADSLEQLPVRRLAGGHSVGPGRPHLHAEAEALERRPSSGATCS